MNSAWKVAAALIVFCAMLVCMSGCLIVRCPYCRHKAVKASGTKIYLCHRCKVFIPTGRAKDRVELIPQGGK